MSEPFSRWHLFVWPGLVLAISIVVTSFIVWALQARTDIEVQTAFQRRFADIAGRIESQLADQAKLLYGFKGLYAASDRVKRDEFHVYFNSLQLTEAESTVVAYHELVSARDFARHVDSVRKQGMPEYRVFPAGEREVYAPLFYLEPFSDENLKVLGFDPLTVGVEREAILRSRDSGVVAISSKLTLVQDASENVPGFVMYVPLYRNGAPQATQTERRSSFIGWIDAPVRMQSFMARAFPNGNPDLDLEIFDGAQMSADTLFFHSDDGKQRPDLLTAESQRVVKQLQFGGHTWTVSMRALPGFGGLAARMEPLLIGSMGTLIGIVLSGGLFLGILAMRRRAVKAQAIVREEQRLLDERALKESESAARLALAETQRALRQLNLQNFALDQHAIVSITNARGEITFANDRLCQISGYSREELLGQYHVIFSSDVTPPEFYKAVCETVASGEVWHGEECCRAKEGHLYWCDSTAVPYLGEKGFPEQCIVIRTDITARKTAELELVRQQEQLEQSVLHKTEKLQRTLDELQVSEEKYRILVEESSDPIFSFCPDGSYRHVNRIFASNFGKKPEDIIGKTLWEIFSQAEADRRFAVVRKVIEQGKVEEIEVVIPGAEGEHYLITTATPIFDDAHRVISVLCISKDITARKKAEEAANAANRAKSEFLANMSHEIRTPLNGVLGMAQIGYRESVGRGRSQEIFTHILSSGKLLLAIINDILDFSKIEAGKLAIESVPVDPCHTVNAALETLRERSREKGIELKTDLAPDLPVAFLSDSIRLSQILLNLLSNAVKFTAQGTVRLSAYLDKSEIVFCISDTGIGMNEAQLARLFQPFEQADSSTTRKYGGTGLGLTISRRLAEMMGGSIEVSSREGVGSTLQLRLPCTPTEIGPDATPPAINDGSRGKRLRGVRILAAEDNEMNQLVLCDLLENEGAQVKMVGNGQLAVAALEVADAVYDIVLMDAQMPVMDGLEATRCIRATHPNLPIIGQTAHALSEEHARCRAAGMNDVITKPLDTDLLVAVVQRYVGCASLKTNADKSNSETTLSLVPATALDWGALERRYPLKPQFLVKICNTFLASYEDAPERIKEAATNNSEQLAQMVHSLKGTAGTLMAHEVVERAKTLELAMHSGETDIAKHAEDLALSLQTMLDEIKNRLKQ